MTFPRTTIVGGTGFIGSEFLRLNSKDNIFSPSSSELDITNKDLVRRFLLETQSGIVINFAGYTNTKKATLDKSGSAWMLNVVGAKNLAEVCKEQDIFLVHISTDAVYPTHGYKGPYLELNDPPYDLNNSYPYGITKLVGEKAIKEVGGKFAIVRIQSPFGSKNPEKDYALKIIAAIEKGLPIFSDQQITPTYIPDIKKALALIVDKKILGVYHVACHPPTTPYEFAVCLAKLMKYKNVKKGSLVEYERQYGKSIYAKNGGLSSRYSEKVLGLKFHSWQQALNELV